MSRHSSNHSFYRNLRAPFFNPKSDHPIFIYRLRSIHRYGRSCHYFLKIFHPILDKVRHRPVSQTNVNIGDGQESRSLEPSLMKHWAVGDVVVGLIGIHSIGHASGGLGRTVILLVILPVLEALAERSSEGPQGELFVCRKGVFSSTSTLTILGGKTDAGLFFPLMARKREQETLCSFFRPGQAPSLFITQQVLLSFLSIDFLPGRTWTNASSDLDRIRPVSAR